MIQFGDELRSIERGFDPQRGNRFDLRESKGQDVTRFRLSIL